MSFVINGKDLVVHFRGKRIDARAPLVIDGSPPRPPSYYDRAATSGWRTHPAFAVFHNEVLGVPTRRDA